MTRSWRRRMRFARELTAAQRLSSSACKPRARRESQAKKVFVSSHYAFDRMPVYYISAVTAPAIPGGAAWLCSGWGTPPHTIFRLQNCIVNLLLLMSRQITCCTERGLWLLLTVSVSCGQGEGREKKHLGEICLSFT